MGHYVNVGDVVRLEKQIATLSMNPPMESWFGNPEILDLIAVGTFQLVPLNPDFVWKAAYFILVWCALTRAIDLRRASSGLTSTAYFPTGAATAHLRIASSGRLATDLATAASRSRWTARDVAPLLRGETTTETPSLLARNAGRNWCQK